MPKTLTIIAIFLITLTILLGLSRQISDALKVSDRLDNAVEELNQLQNKNRALKENLADAESYTFVEEIARNKLNLSRPEETVVIIPNETFEAVIAARAPKPEPPKLPNWQGWLKLFGLNFST